MPTYKPTQIPTTLPSPKPTSVPSPVPTIPPTPLPTIVCPRGKYVALDGATCEACTVGRYSNATIPPFPKGECFLCEPGKVSKVSEATECSRCAEGKFSAAARDLCSSCGSGQYVLNASACEYCEIGKYAPVALEDACIKCAAGSATGSAIGATTCTDCSPGTVYTPHIVHSHVILVYRALL